MLDKAFSSFSAWGLEIPSLTLLFFHGVADRLQERDRTETGRGVCAVWVQDNSQGSTLGTPSDGVETHGLFRLQ